VACSIGPAEACFQVSLPRSHLVVLGEMRQLGDQPVVAVEDQQAFFIAPGLLNRARFECHRDWPDPRYDIRRNAKPSDAVIPASGGPIQKSRAQG
jgi:hypothetical protein